MPPEPWASEPPASWPQIVLTNSAEFHGHTSLEGASAFLIAMEDGRTLAATAKHLIGQAGGVEPEIALGELDQAIDSWVLYPRTREDDALEIDRLALQVNRPTKALDWLVLTLRPDQGELPATPLRIRTERVTIGERVYLIGCPYSQQDCAQNVYTCTVTSRGPGPRFRYRIQPPVELRGFSGAPLVDRDGHLVGVMTIWFEPDKTDAGDAEGGAEEAGVIRPFIAR